MNVVLSSSLEKLADRCFSDWEDAAQDPLRQRCVVINNRVSKGWLRHFFVYERTPGRQRVLAGWDVQFLNVFVNDWLYPMGHQGQGKREPAFHPYSRNCLQWRLYALLSGECQKDAVYAPLRAYLGADPIPDRQMALAGILSKLFDEYQLYRPEMLKAWENGNVAHSETSTAWQPALWNALRALEPESYLKQFLDMETRLSQCGIQKRYSCVGIFAVSTMPPVYLRFFHFLSKLLPVTLYVFCPGDDVPGSRVEKGQKSLKESSCDSAGLEQACHGDETVNPLLASLGKAALEHVGEALKLAETSGDSIPDLRQDDTLLHKVQKDIQHPRRAALDRRGASGDNRSVAPDDASVQIHICHSPLREVEVLRDHMLAWFARDPALQPRHIQVQVSHMATYAPYIDAVFSTRKIHAAQTIPYAIADRFVASTTATARAFLQLLSLPQTRFTSSEIMGLLDSEAIQQAVGLEPADVILLREWVKESGIRWGMHREHRKIITHVNFEDATTWRHGLDRMLLGYALGPSSDDPSSPACNAGNLGPMLPFDPIEGGNSEKLGRLAGFLESLQSEAAKLAKPCSLTEWMKRLESLIDRFFVATNETYLEVGRLRNIASSISRIGESLRIQGPIPLEAIRTFVKQEIESAESSDDMVRNAVVFSALRASSSTPRPIMCLIGINDGAFPRSERRALFDLLGQEPRPGDPNLRWQDRQAFLEALMCAKDRFYLSYCGRTDKENAKTPPSVVVSELREYLTATFDLPPGKRSPDGQDLLFCETLHHLQAFHPDYFEVKGEQEILNRLFSFSKSNLAAARKLVEARKQGDGPARPRAAGRPTQREKGSRTITLFELVRFFRNPAQRFYQEILKVRFDADILPVLPESETFEIAGGLDAYQVDQEILKAQVRNVSPEEVRLWLTEKGQIPLGQLGSKAFQKHWVEIQEFLKTEVPLETTPMTLGQILGQKTTPRDLIIPLGEWLMDGRVLIRRVGGLDLLFFCRYATLKAKDRLASWLQHLACFATGLSPRTLVKGKENKITQFQTVGPEEAKEILRGLLGHVETGRRIPLPFAPATSEAYWKAYAETDGESDDEKRKKRALLRARTIWEGNEKSPGDSADPYLFRAFGEEGPMVDEQFEKLALEVFKDLHASIQNS